MDRTAFLCLILLTFLRTAQAETVAMTEAPAQPAQQRSQPVSAQDLFGPGKIPTIAQGDAKAKSASKMCRASWSNFRSKAVTKKDISQTQINELLQRARSQGFNEKYLKKALASFLANQAQIPNQRYVTFIDFTKRSTEKRLIVVDLSNFSLKGYPVAAGSGTDPDGDGYANKFSNQHGSHASSLGCYIANGNFTDGKGRPSLLIHGIESTNDNACARGVFMHTAKYVGGVPGRSWGCPAVRAQDQKEIYAKIGGGGLMCAYHDASEVKNARRR